jgi:hypothetical protein
MAFSANQTPVQNQIDHYEKTIKGQNDLIDKQAKLIHVLASLIEKNGLLDNKKGHQGGGGGGGGGPQPDNPPKDNSAEQDSGPASYGPDSPPVQWTGEWTDIIRVTIDGKHYKAFIFDESIAYYWNWLLNLRRKIPKYKEEYDEEVAVSTRTKEIFEECTKLKESGDNSHFNSIRMRDAGAAHNSTVARGDEIFSRLERLSHTKTVLNRRLARFFRFVLIKNNLRTVEDMTWMDELRASKQAKYNNKFIHFNKRFDDEELNRAPLDEVLELPPSAPASENGDSQDSNNDQSQESAA